MSTLKIRHEISSSTVKAISLWQPWASLIPLRLKQYETRSWKTNYRGKLLLVSTAPNSLEHQQYLKISDELQLPPWNKTNFPHGCALAVCDLTDCIQMTAEFINQQSAVETLCGDWQSGRYAWKLENIQPIEPFAVKGKQGLFSIPLPEICIKYFVSTQVLEDGDWKGRSLSVPRHKVREVQAMIGSHRAVNEISRKGRGQRAEGIYPFS